MRKLAIRTLFLFLLMGSASLVKAQQTISISGKITAAEDGQPVPQASINIYRKGVGTATNSSGLFGLIIPAANHLDTLKISSVGFKTKQLAIADLKNGQELKIVLEKSSTELKEVTITYYDPLKVIQKALARIPENYINHPHILRGFYRMYTYSDQVPLQLSEAVFDVYNFGYGDKHADLFKLIKARNEKNTRDFSLLELGQKPNSIFEEDLVNHLYTSGFLSANGLAKHKYTAAGIVDIKGYRAYQINFREKAGETDGTFRGRMYIDTKTYAFIYFDFGLSPDGLTNLSTGNFATRALMGMGNVQLTMQRDHAKVSYQEVGNKWVLSSVDGDDTMVIKTPGATTDLLAHVKFNYQVTAVDTVAKESFSSKIGRNDNINNYDSNAGEKFWKDYNILLSDFDAEDIFKQLQDINKQNK